MNRESDSVDESSEDPPERRATTPAPRQLLATAYHEAGHAVMALLLGRNLQRVTIEPGKSRLGDLQLGRCEIKKDRSKPSKDLVEDEVLILFAGMVAEARFTGKYCTNGASQDLRAISRLLQERAGNDRQFVKLHRRMLDKAEHLLDDDATIYAVELITQELMERLTISGRSARHFYEQAVKKYS